MRLGVLGQHRKGWRSRSDGHGRVELRGPIHCPSPPFAPLSTWVVAALARSHPPRASPLACAPGLHRGRLRGGHEGGVQEVGAGAGARGGEEDATGTRGLGLCRRWAGGNKTPPVRSPSRGVSISTCRSQRSRSMRSHASLRCLSSFCAGRAGGKLGMLPRQVSRSVWQGPVHVLDRRAAQIRKPGETMVQKESSKRKAGKQGWKASGHIY